MGNSIWKAVPQIKDDFALAAFFIAAVVVILLALVKVLASRAKPAPLPQKDRLAASEIWNVGFRDASAASLPPKLLAPLLAEVGANAAKRSLGVQVLIGLSLVLGLTAVVMCMALLLFRPVIVEAIRHWSPRPVAAHPIKGEAGSKGPHEAKPSEPESIARAASAEIREAAGQLESSAGDSLLPAPELSPIEGGRETRPPAPVEAETLQDQSPERESLVPSDVAEAAPSPPAAVDPKSAREAFERYANERREDFERKRSSMSERFEPLRDALAQYSLREIWEPRREAPLAHTSYEDFVEPSSRDEAIITSLDQRHGLMSPPDDASPAAWGAGEVPAETGDESDDYMWDGTYTSAGPPYDRRLSSGFAPAPPRS